MLVMCPESNNTTSHICPAHPQKPWLLPPLLTTASDTSGLSLSPYLSSAPPHRTTKTSSRVRTGPGGAPRHPDVQPLSFPQHPFSARQMASRVIQPSCPCSSGNEHPQLPSSSHSSHGPGIIQQVCLTYSTPNPSPLASSAFVHLGISMRLGRQTDAGTGSQRGLGRPCSRQQWL